MKNIDIIDRVQAALEMTNSESSAYFNKENGEIVWVFEYMDNDKDLVEDIESCYEKYIALPTQYDIDEYSIMNEFAYSYDNAEISNELLHCLRGSGAFHRFKDKVIHLGILEEWFGFRDNAYRKIAEDWCIKNRLIPLPPKKILLTSFIDASSEKLVKFFDSNYNKLFLENNKAKSVLQLTDAINTEEYDYVFSFGQKPVIVDKIYIEQYGKNGNTTYETDADLARLAKAFMVFGLTVRLSENAGTSYCNNIYAHGLEYIFANDLKTQMIFIHIPFMKNISDSKVFFENIIKTIDEFIRLDNIKE